MRPSLSPEEFRAAGIYLNAGRRRGWRKRLAQLLNTPEATIAAWASRTPGNARSVPGVVAVALRLLVVMVRQRELSGGDLPSAAQLVTEQVLLLLRVPEFMPPPAERVAERPAEALAEPPAMRPDGPQTMAKPRGLD